MVHYCNLTLCQLKVLLNGLEVVIFFHHSRSKDATGTVKFRVVCKKDGTNLIERCYEPFKLSGRPSRRFVSLESVVNELERFYSDF